MIKRSIYRENKLSCSRRINESVDVETLHVLNDYVVMCVMMLKGNAKKTPFNADVNGLQKDLEDAMRTDMGIKNTVHSYTLGADINYTATYEHGCIILMFYWDKNVFQFTLDGKFAEYTLL